jgi:hypothetical protein
VAADFQHSTQPHRRTPRIGKFPNMGSQHPVCEADHTRHYSTLLDNDRTCKAAIALFLFPCPIRIEINAIQEFQLLQDIQKLSRKMPANA